MDENAREVEEGVDRYFLATQFRLNDRIRHHGQEMGEFRSGGREAERTCATEPWFDEKPIG